MINYASGNYTPGKAEIAATLSNYFSASETEQKQIEEALLRAEFANVRRALEQALETAVRPERAKLAYLLSLLARQRPQVLQERMIELTADSDLKTQLTAIRALGHLPSAESESRLLDLLQLKARAEIQKACVESLAKIGGYRALAKLSAAKWTVDQRVLEKARLILERSVKRSTTREVVLTDELQNVFLECRPGLEQYLITEIKEKLGLKAYRLDRGSVELIGSASYAALLKLRSFDRWGFIVRQKVVAGEGLEELRKLLLPNGAIHRLLVRNSNGDPTFRLSSGGLSRARLWQFASETQREILPLRNDPTDSLWHLQAQLRLGELVVQIHANQIKDPRFAYRVAEVPAASKPSLAAVLVGLARVRAGERVWDPFVGSGCELAEVQLRTQSGAKVVGSDLDSAALAAAAKNLSGFTNVELLMADATTFTAVTPDVIVTNPPMGRRVLCGEVVETLLQFIANAARILRPAGRLVWVSAFPDRTAAALRKAGFHLDSQIAIDMGGFAAEIQVARKL